MPIAVAQSPSKLAVELPAILADRGNVSARDMRSHPIGTRPFKLDECKPNQSIPFPRPLPHTNSPLEGSGFEPSVPLKECRRSEPLARKETSGVGNGVSSTAGPMVRIRFPPAASQERTPPSRSLAHSTLAELMPNGHLVRRCRRLSLRHRQSIVHPERTSSLCTIRLGLRLSDVKIAHQWPF